MSRIESIGGADCVYIGGGWEGGSGVGCEGGWGAVGGLKQPFKHKWQCCPISR